MMKTPRRRWWGAHLGWCGLLLLLPSGLGCGPGTGQVSGDVLFNGKPVPGGTVTFQPADNRYNTVSAQIDENGHYQATVPAGDALIAVDNRALQEAAAPGAGTTSAPPPKAVIGPPAGAMEKAMEGKGAPGGQRGPMAGSQKPPGKYVPIPKKYYNTATSDLKYTVQRGAQQHPIELTK
jgi:hypothetical protein